MISSYHVAVQSTAAIHQRNMVRENFRAFKQLTPEQRNKLRERWRNASPEERRKMLEQRRMRQELRRLRPRN